MTDELDYRRVRSSVLNRLFGAAVEPVEIGRFVLLGELGAGGMGRVYLAYDPALERKVAIKLIRTDATSDPQRRSARLVQEAKALARLEHPNVVAVHEAGEYEGSVFIVTAYVEGVTLSSWLRSEPRDWEQMREMLSQAGRGLAAAHAAGLVHRDFKPDNVLVDAQGGIRVADFGLAKSLGDTQADISPPVESPVVEALTVTGSTVGTPAYMAPEQSKREATPRSDQFSFCVVAYEALYGVRPFAGDSLEALVENIEAGRIRDASPKVAVPKQVRAAILKGLRARPDERHPDMQSLLRVFEARARSPARSVLLLGGLGLLLVGVGLMDDDGSVCVAPSTAELWDSDRRERLAQRFEATGRPYAQTTFASLVDGIDRRIEDLVEVQSAACQSHHIDRVTSSERFDRQMACIAERRTELDAFLEGLEDLESSQLDRIVTSMASLSSARDCADPERLGSGPVGNMDAQRRADIVQARELLARASGKRAVGRPQEGLRAAQQARELAEAAGDGYTLAAAELGVGKMLQASAQYEDARTVLRRAYFGALAERNDPVLVEAATMLLATVGLNLKRPDEALEWWDHGTAGLRRLDPEARSLARAQLCDRAALAFRAKGDLEQAETLGREALEIRERELGPRHALVGVTLTNLGTVLVRARKTEKAVEALERGVDVLSESLGETHPHVGVALQTLGIAQRVLQRLEDAERSLSRAIAIGEQRLGRTHSTVISARGSRAATWSDMGRLEQARDEYIELIELRAKALGADHADVATLHNNLGTVLRRLEDYEGARQRFERAREIWRAALGEDHLKVASAHANLGVVHARTDAWKESEAAYRAAHSIWQAGQHPDRWQADAGIGTALLGQKRAADALPWLESATQSLDGKANLSADLGEVRVRLGMAMWEVGNEPATARRHIEEGLEMMQPAAELKQQTVAAARAWLDDHPVPADNG